MNKSLHELLLAMEEDRLDVHGLAKLNALLRSDPTMRADLVRYVSMSGAIRRQGLGAMAWPSLDTGNPSLPRHRRRRGRRSPGPESQAVKWIAIVFGLVLACVLSVSFAEPEQVATTRSPVHADEVSVAELAPVVINFGPKRQPSHPGMKNDSGERYTPERGYGWQTGMDRRFRSRGPNSPGKRTAVFAAGNATVDRWIIDLPNGRYRVTVGCGDGQEQGPSRIVIQGVRVVDDVLTAAGEYIERSAVVTVTAGQLQMLLGSDVAGNLHHNDTTVSVLSIQRID